MHTVFFHIKRVHLRVLHVTRVLLRGIRITPARFDMMRIVGLQEEHGVGQSRIQELLGVSAPTVSVMLASLEELGYVVRERMAHDARRLLVKLTALGRQVLDETLVRLIPWVAHRMARRGLAFDVLVGEEKMDSLRGHLENMRTIYGDSAAYENPWEAAELEREAVPYTHLVDGKIVYEAPIVLKTGFSTPPLRLPLTPRTPVTPQTRRTPRIRRTERADS